MSKKNLMVVAVFLAGVLGGGSAALAFSQDNQSEAAAGRCTVDRCIINGRCVICPEF